MKMTFEGDWGIITKENDDIGISDYVWSCFYLLLAAGCDPRNLCQSFAEVSEEISEAWLEKTSYDFGDVFTELEENG